MNKLNLVVDSVVDGVDLSLLFIIAQGSNADCNLSSSSCILAWLDDDDELEDEVDEREVETLTLTLGSFLLSGSLKVVEWDDVTVDFLVVVEARLVNLWLSRSGGSDVGRNPTDELECNLVVVVVLTNVEDGLLVVVDVRSEGLLLTIFELVGVIRN